MSASEAELDTDAVHPTDLTLFQQELLYTVGRDRRDYGQGIQESLEERYDDGINHGRLYPNLDELIELGLLEKEARDKRSNWYVITPAGKELLRRDAQYRYGVAEGLTQRGGD